ncbi:MAG TPA: lamin tail domain-containing protein, partial [Promineifilum sp.]|nr:lamin tail domain-containing protein [Promineifilum sp.]
MSRKTNILLVISLALLLAVVVITSGASAQGQTLFINEILVGNASTTLDTDYYNYSSWIEIYNGGNSAIDLKNYSLAYWDDGAPDPIAWKVPVSVSIPAKGYVIFWA